MDGFGATLVASTYKAFFHGREYLAGGKQIWKTRAPLKCPFFFSLSIYGRCWTSDQLFRHGLKDDNKYALYDQEVETVDHLLLGCVHSWECWFKLFCFSGLHGLTPGCKPFRLVALLEKPNYESAQERI